MSQLRFSLSSESVLYFFEKMQGPIKLFQLFTAVSAIFLLFLTYESYKIRQASAALTSHIANFKLFNQFVLEEVDKKTEIKAASIDVFLWYKKIHPNSEDGSLKVSKHYGGCLSRVEKAISETNALLTEPKVKYNYKEHQTAMIDALSELGISMDRNTKNQFIQTERTLFQLIDSVNQVFMASDKRLSDIKRVYA